jgi:hypothetical protein
MTNVFKANFGGFGGIGATYPRRQERPDSQVVQSNDEFGVEQAKRLEGVPQTITSYSPGRTETGFNQSWVDYSRLQPNWGVVSSRNSSMGDNGYTSSAYPTGLSFLANIPYSRTVGGGSSTSPNPEYERLKKLNEGEMQNRMETQTAQQQAYDNMLGNEQKNAVMSGAYSNPNFGAVDGNFDSPYLIDNSAGANLDSLSGVYDPNSAGATGVYGGNGAATTKKNFWGL